MCQIGLSKSILVASLSSIFSTRIFYWKGDLFCVILHRSACSLYHSISVLLSLLQSVGSAFLSGRSALQCSLQIAWISLLPIDQLLFPFRIFLLRVAPESTPSLNICCHLPGFVTRVSLYLSYLTYFTVVRVDGNHTIDFQFV